MYVVVLAVLAMQYLIKDIPLFRFIGPDIVIELDTGTTYFKQKVIHCNYIKPLKYFEKKYHYKAYTIKTTFLLLLYYIALFYPHQTKH